MSILRRLIYSMTWSLKLHHGDLQKTGNELAKVSNEAKLVQDLRCQFLYEMGMDKMHPDYGSLIDGGTMPNGTVKESLIGMDDKEYVKSLLYTEINRIIADYQERQLARAKADKMVYGKATLTRSEVIAGVKGIDVVERLDGLRVIISLETGAQTIQNIELSIGN